jgi:O-6-methylguanine DNA methyltransferase
MIRLYTSVFRTALGWAGIVVTDHGLAGIVLPRTGKRSATREVMSDAARILRGQVHRRRSDDRTRIIPVRRSVLAQKAKQALRDYFSGRSVTFALPLDLRLSTRFQRKVWKATAEIAYGETRSYASIARRIGRPKSARAVGQALGANPLPVLIPCHRVVTSGGALGGFSGGRGMKKKLLHLERQAGV